ncbi:MAG: OB-fold nucleic acid binding domain-containing protein, partial [Bacilli bacterium]
MDLLDIYKDIEKFKNKEVVLEGWIRNRRNQKEFGFIDFSDGTCFNTIQIVYDTKLEKYDEISKFLVGSAIKVTGKVIESIGTQDIEVMASDIELLGSSTDDYPIQPKRHTREFLR